MKKKLRKIYGKYYQDSPIYLKNILSRSIFAMTNKPFVKKTTIFTTRRFPKSLKGGFIVSADFELGWAFRYSKTNPHPEKMALQSRKNFPFLIKVFEEYNIPITWATVGHLFLKECKKGDHAWMHRIPYFENKDCLYKKGDWFDCDPHTSWEKAKSWYAPDLIEMILNSKVKHEIACHSYSHIDLSSKNCPLEVAEDEIQACVDSAKRWNITLKSMVFPGGACGNIDVLKKYGVHIYRKKINHDLAYPFYDKYGLLITPSSTTLGDNGFGWNSEYIIKRLKKYIDKAINTGTFCHFWFHPSMDDCFLRNIFPEILHYASDKREDGDLWVATMGDTVDHIKRDNIE